ncbi:MAG: hypothetical protein CSA65_07255 [Proteobacteria bacterium]|nr:MAG: hypothetical protein CSB49_02185 [Pseudomonadota bacterium]PIE17812.1 MAG: hypothetical protein CSA65_07255 [Pseudomonadota bacterium]
MNVSAARNALPLGAVALALAGLCACAEDAPTIGRRELPVAALCTVLVRTGGSTNQLDTENDYIPHVVACEHGNATEPATLEAQAVAARGYAYYKVTIEKKTLDDSQGDQVYGCPGRNLEDLSATQRARIKTAVAKTKGQILTHNSLLIAPFYVAGSSTNNASCKPSASQQSGTEKHVTYNEGKSGSAVTPSSLGSSSSPRNRGCMSQLGALCLAKKGYDYQQILRFYYGADITIATTTGSCGGGGPPTCVPQPEVCNGADDDCDGVIDDGDPGGGAVCVVGGEQGPCALGQTRCQGGALICQQTVTPLTESCNGIDDNCNGQVDDVPGGCGACTPKAEICNGIDDDCDGVIDDGDPQGGQACYTGGSCPVGVTKCTPQGLVCTPAPRPEVCNGVDDDCNGTIDDVPGGCGGAGGASDGGAAGCTPTKERCNGIDDDCDGFPDENDPGGGAPCTIVGPQGFSGVLACVGGKLTCWSTTPGGGGGGQPPDPTLPAEHGGQLEGACAVGGAATSPPLPLSLLALLMLARLRARRRTP